ncbi:urea carboxylase-associated family protein [Bradyrhizobium sp. KBS0727]|nr:urea carboxylase-associated family protein [Bradyrhizobium sp. KBS0725]QDW46637.1 urea carboxylase-associated family protein [Bradyrhizobium sp. KBS0727]
MATILFRATDEPRTRGSEAVHRNQFGNSCIQDLPSYDLSKGRVHGRDGRQTAVEPAATRTDGPHHRARRGARSRGPGSPGAARIRRRPQGGDFAMSLRQVISEFVLEPGTGKAIELLKGQILRIEQVEGGQCADFNAFNLHDYKEFMHCGRTRTVHGFHPTKGTFMWSAPPRERAMLYILEDTVGRNDVLFPRCSAYVYEASYGFAVHTNCHDIQAEAQREYGLTPDDVHDSFNLFMCTGVDDDGHAFMTRQTTKAGDHVDLLALMDVLAVPNVCGADVMKTSNFALKPLKLTVFAATAADIAAVPKTPVLASQRTPKDFRNSTIKTDRPLRRDPAYRAEFPNTPIVVTELPIALSPDELALFNAVKRTDIYGGDDAAALRDLLFSWWEERFLLAHAGAPAIEKARGSTT